MICKATRRVGGRKSDCRMPYGCCAWCFSLSMLGRIPEIFFRRSLTPRLFLSVVGWPVYANHIQLVRRVCVWCIFLLGREMQSRNSLSSCSCTVCSSSRRLGMIGEIDRDWLRRCANSVFFCVALIKCAEREMNEERTVERRRHNNVPLLHPPKPYSCWCTHKLRHKYVYMPAGC